MPWSKLKEYQPSVGVDQHGYWCARCGDLRKPCKHFPESMKEKEKEVETLDLH